MDIITVFAADNFEVTVFDTTPEGYLVAKDVNIARTGVQNYYAYELGLDKEMGMNPMQMIRLNRSPEDVFAPDSMKTFEGAPLTIDHPAGGVTQSNWKQLANGDARNIARDGDFMKADLTIKTKEAVDAFKAGKKQLSNGYAFALDMKPGTNHKGEAYDGSMKNIRGNHVAMVKAARCGSACRIADSNPYPNGETAMNLQKVVVDGIPLEVSDTAAAAITNLITARDTAKAELKVATDKLATAVDATKHAEAITAKDAEIAQLKKDVFTPAQRDALVADWAAMTATAKKLHPAIVMDGKTCAEVRKEVVGHVIAKDAKAKATADAILGGKALEAADADAVRTVFQVLATTAGPVPQGKQAKDADKLGEALAGKSTTHATDSTPKLTGRAAMLARDAQAWNGGAKQ